MILYVFDEYTIENKIKDLRALLLAAFELLLR